jgi:hypothetical protein
MVYELMRFPSATRFLHEIDGWLYGEPASLYDIARHWFGVFRDCGDDVRELLHDGCPVACVGDAAFGYVNVFSRHVNVGFFTGAFLDDPDGLLEGSGMRMRHVKIRPGEEPDARALTKLISQAYADVRRKNSRP